MRFPLDVMRAVRAVVPKGLPLGARITGSDWMEGGLSPADAVACAKMLKQAGCDDVDGASGGGPGEARNPLAPRHNAGIAGKLRPAGASPSRRPAMAWRHH